MALDIARGMEVLHNGTRIEGELIPIIHKGLSSRNVSMEIHRSIPTRDRYFLRGVQMEQYLEHVLGSPCFCVR